MSTISVPVGFGYVLAALASTSFLLLGQTMVVGRYRKAAKIAYPQLYAEKAEAATSIDAYKFNCAQRAHQNTLESMPMIMTSAIITGLQFPVASASMVGAWVLGRVLYTRGYLADPTKRNSQGGFIAELAGLGLILGTTYTAGQFALAGL